MQALTSKVHSRSGILWVAAGAALWGTDTVFRRPLATTLDPTRIVLYEHVILSVVVLPILVRGRAYITKISSRSWFALLGIAWIGSALSTVLFTMAIRSGSPTTAVLLQKVQPLFAIALARVLLGERWPIRFAWIVATAILGSYLVAFGNADPFASSATAVVVPAGLALAAAAGWGFATVLGRIAGAEIPFELLTALRLTCALPALFVAAWFTGQTNVPPASQLLRVVWVALVPGFAALMLYYLGLRDTPASKATIAELAFPATAALLNWSILGVQTSLLQWIGFAIIWSAIAGTWSVREGRRPV